MGLEKHSHGLAPLVNLGPLHSGFVAAGVDQTAELRRSFGLMLCGRFSKKSFKDKSMGL